MLQGQDGAAAVYFDGESINMASNSQEPSELANKIIEHLSLVSNTNCEQEGFINELSKSRNQLINYARSTNRASNEWFNDFVADLRRIESSIHARIILNNPGNPRLRECFEITAPERIAFSTEMLEALKVGNAVIPGDERERRGIEFIPGDEGVHAELKLTQKILEKWASNPFANFGQDYIGISKKCCINCQSAIMAVNKLFPSFAGPPRPLDAMLPGNNNKIVTRDILIGENGSGLPFPCRPPNFLSKNPEPDLGPETRLKLIKNFLTARRQLNSSTIKTIDQAFNENSRHMDGHIVVNKIKRTHSLSPTGRDFAAGRYAVMLQERERQALETESQKIGRQARTEESDEEETNKNVSAKAKFKAKKPLKTLSKKSKLKSGAEDDYAFLDGEIKKVQLEKAEAEIQFQLEKAEALAMQQSQPIIIFYERLTDPTSTKIITTLLGKMKELNVGNLLMVDNGLAEKNITPLTHYRRLGTQIKKSSSSDRNATIEEAVTNPLQMLELATRLEMKIHNAAKESGTLTAEESESRGILTPMINERLLNLKAGGKNVSQIFHDEQIMDIFKDLVNSSVHITRGKRIANKIFEECSKDTGVVALLDIDDGKTVEQSLAALGCSNVVSFFVYNNTIEPRTEDLVDSMWKYNQDYAQAQMMPNSIIIDQNKVPDVASLIETYLQLPNVLSSEHEAGTFVRSISESRQGTKKASR